MQHGYMMRGSPKAFDARAREFSMTRAVAILDGFSSRNVQVDVCALPDSYCNILSSAPTCNLKDIGRAWSSNPGTARRALYVLQLLPLPVNRYKSPIVKCDNKGFLVTEC